MTTSSVSQSIEMKMSMHFYKSQDNRLFYWNNNRWWNIKRIFVICKEEEEHCNNFKDYEELLKGICCWTIKFSIQFSNFSSSFSNDLQMVLQQSFVSFIDCKLPQHRKKGTSKNYAICRRCFALACKFIIHSSPLLFCY